MVGGVVVYTGKTRSAFNCGFALPRRRLDFQRPSDCRPSTLFMASQSGTNRMHAGSNPAPPPPQLLWRNYCIRRADVVALASLMKPVRGRRAFHAAVKVDPRGRLERMEERMLARVTASRVKFPAAENPRVPQQ